jgi:hypothetical protein
MICGSPSVCPVLPQLVRQLKQQFAPSQTFASAKADPELLHVLRLPLHSATDDDVAAPAVSLVVEGTAVRPGQQCSAAGDCSAVAAVPVKLERATAFQYDKASRATSFGCAISTQRHQQLSVSFLNSSSQFLRFKVRTHSQKCDLHQASATPMTPLSPRTTRFRPGPPAFGAAACWKQSWPGRGCGGAH